MVKKGKAAVLVSKEKMEIREYALPKIGKDDALLKLEACGMCGTDLDYYYGNKKPGPSEHKDFQYPFIPGHEPIGTIEEIGAEATKRWGVKAGDRVAVQYYTCGVCKACAEGRQMSCESPIAGIGKAGVHLSPALWGGYAEYMYIPPRAHVFPVSKSLPAKVAGLFNPFAGAFAWTVERSGLKPGQSVAILGPGQRGLASVVAARESGASFIAVVGRGRNPYKLQLARELGADLVVNLEQEDPVAAVKKATRGAGVDIAVDITPAPESFDQAVSMVKRGGTVVEAGLKRGKTIRDWCPDPIQHKNLSVLGAYGVSTTAVRSAIKLVESGKYPIEKLVSHTFPLAKTEEALQTLAGKFPERHAMNVVLLPGA